MKEIKAYPLNDTEYLAEDLRKWAFATTTGVFSLENNLKTTANNNMSITISKGIGFINDGTGGLSIWSEENKILSIDTADGLLNRIDSVVMRWNKITNKTYIDIRKGMKASLPIAPQPTRNTSEYELVLAHIKVSAGTTAITSQMITDTRLNSSICGLVKNSVENIPTEQINEQFELYLKELQSKLEDAGKIQLIDGAVNLAKLNSSLKSTLVFKSGTKLVDYQGASLLNLIYPIGITIEFDRLIDPGTLFGGTWIRTHKGRFPVGVDESDLDFNTPKKVGGEKKHTLTVAEMPVHNHMQILGGAITTAAPVPGDGVIGRANTSYTNNTGGNGSHNNIPPYETAYFWKRTA